LLQPWKRKRFGEICSSRDLTFQTSKLDYIVFAVLAKVCEPLEGNIEFFNLLQWCWSGMYWHVLF